MQVKLKEIQSFSLQSFNGNLYANLQISFSFGRTRYSCSRLFCANSVQNLWNIHPNLEARSSEPHRAAEWIASLSYRDWAVQLPGTLQPSLTLL